ncbi:MAG: hypothetical protein KQJ78_04475 [Deltaproteobacteria bacterium]|nr:hypothetical protein [Deltaproteobacteria bacterium]
MRTILSTGSPLGADSFHYVYRDIKADLCLSSISGGSDLVGCFAGGNPIGAGYAGQLQVRNLGMAVEAWDDQGQPVVGQKGELVCVKPRPSMPVGFWNEPDGAKYHDAYFAEYPKVRSLHAASCPVQCRFGKNVTPPQQAELAGGPVFAKPHKLQAFLSMQFGGPSLARIGHCLPKPCFTASFDIIST